MPKTQHTTACLDAMLAEHEADRCDCATCDQVRALIRDRAGCATTILATAAFAADGAFWWSCVCGDEGGPHESFNEAWDATVRHERENSRPRVVSIQEPPEYVNGMRNIPASLARRKPRGDASPQET